MRPFDPEKITYFAESDYRNQNQRFGIKQKDRTRHVYIIGKTGMGKSVLMSNMAIQDIQMGHGMTVIDPHGSLAEDLLDYIPESRIDDVLYFAPFDLEHPISFNVMEDVGPEKRHLVANGLMSAFKRIWVDMWSARMEYILNNILLALLEYPDATIIGVNRMLADKTYRKNVIKNITDVSVKAFWEDEFSKYGERYMQEAGASIQNKIGQFVSNPLVRNLVGQPKSSFNVRKLMDEQKLVIVNLSKGQVGEDNANLIGSMLITKMYLAAMSRADLSPAEMEKLPNFYFFVDEFQSFANESFEDILSEARKYKLNLTIAHQYIEQMTPEVRAAVFGNVGTMISFRVGATDAEHLEKEFAPEFTAQDLVNLDFTQIYLKLMINGVGSKPFSAKTIAPFERPGISYRNRIIERSREQFARPRAEIEEDVIKWHKSPHGLINDPNMPKEEGTSSPKPPANTNPQNKKKSNTNTKNKNNKSRQKQNPPQHKKETNDVREKKFQQAISLAQLERKKEEDKEDKKNKQQEQSNNSSHLKDLRNALSSVLKNTQNISKKEETKKKEKKSQSKEERKEKEKSAREVSEEELRKILE